MFKIENDADYEEWKSLTDGQPIFRSINIYTKEYEHIPENAPNGNYTHCKSVFDIRKALLDYRRKNNMYQVDDYVVYRTLPHARLFCVKSVFEDSIVIQECWDEAGAKCFSEFSPFDDIRHAEDREIEARQRL